MDRESGILDGTNPRRSAKVESGRYNSASEVVREALRLLEEQDSARAAQLAEFNQELGRCASPLAA